MPIRLSHDFPTVSFFDSDRGATPETKMAALAELKEDLSHPLHQYGNPRTNLHFMYIDVSDVDFKIKLESEGVQLDKPTLFVCEGLTMYLTKEQVSSLLTGLHAFHNSKNQLAISFSQRGQEDKSGHVSRFFRSRAEEAYNLSFTPQQALMFLNQHGYNANASLDYNQLIEQSGIKQNVIKKSLVTQFNVSPVANNLTQTLDSIETYPLETPHYSVKQSL